MQSNAPDDFIARRLLESGVFPQQILQQAWQLSQAHGISFLLALERIANLPQGESSRLANLAQQTWLQSQSAELRVSASDLSPALAQSAAHSGSNELSSSLQGALPSASAGASPTDINPVLPGYDIHGELSRGGMGAVFRATHLDSGRMVALKVILSANPGDRELRRFEYEARTLDGLEHPGIVGLIDKGEFNAKPYLAMELVKGRTLKAIVTDAIRDTGKVPAFAWSCQILAQLADALDFCHQRGITHRDLKPENVLIEEGTDRPVLVDFGLIKRDKESLSQSLVELQEELTLSGAVAGTPAFMAPEQLDNVDGPPIGPHTDIWGFGATAYFVFTGRPPFGGASIVNLYKALLTKKPEAPKSINPDLPERLDDLVNSCLERDIDLRPTARAIVDKLASKQKTMLRSTRRALVLATLFIPLTLFAVSALIPNQTVPLEILLTFDPPEDIYLPRDRKDIEEVNLRLHVSSFHGNLDLNPRIGNTPLPFSQENDGEFRISIPTRLIPEHGDGILNVFALDSQGNKGRRSLTIRNDLDPPTITITEQIAAIADKPFEIKGIVDDRGSGPGQLSIVESQATGHEPTTHFSTTLTTQSFAIQLPSLKPGFHKLVLQASDRVGNVTRHSFDLIRRPMIAVGFGKEQAWAQATVEDLPAALSHPLNRVDPSNFGAELILAPKDYTLPDKILRPSSFRIRPGFQDPTKDNTTPTTKRVRLLIKNSIFLDTPSAENEIHDVDFLVHSQFPGASKAIVLTVGDLLIRGCTFSPELGAAAINPDTESFDSSSDENSKHFFDGRGIAIGTKDAKIEIGAEPPPDHIIRLENTILKNCCGSAISNYLNRTIIIDNCLIEQTQKKAIENHHGLIILKNSTINITLEEGIYLEESAKINIENLSISNTHRDALRLTNGIPRSIDWKCGKITNCGRSLLNNGSLRNLSDTHTTIFIENGQATLDNILIDMHKRPSALVSARKSNLKLLNSKVIQADPAFAVSQDSQVRIKNCQFERCKKFYSSPQKEPPGRLLIDFASRAILGAEIPDNLRLDNPMPD